MNEFLNLPPLRKTRKAKPKTVPMPQWCKDRYCQAHEKDFASKYSKAYPSHYFKPDIPDCNKSGGLQQAIIKFLTWDGWYANRINSTGRKIGDKWITGNTKKGTADLHLIIKGVHISAEIKIGADKMSQDQHLEKARVEKAGGKYWIVKTFEDFLVQFDNFLQTLF